jgi:hypothetical protein
MEGVTPSMAGPQGDAISPNITASGWGGWVVVASEESGDGVDVAGSLRSARFEQETSATNREQQTMRRRIIMKPFWQRYQALPKSANVALRLHERRDESGDDDED